MALDHRTPASHRSTAPAYNPYGRGHLKLTSSNDSWSSSTQPFTSQETFSIRKIHTGIRKFLSSWSSSPLRPTSPSSLLNAQTLRFVAMCSIWYTTSALSSNTGKVILNRFRYPVTLTIVQFAFVSLWSAICMSPVIRMGKMRSLNKSVIRTTLPMGMFQVGGHIFSSLAIARIPVSTVHTIKALSPLFTVAAYALLFGVSYSARTYFSLLPLTLGVMLACSFDTSASNFTGLACAFGSALVFVSSNIFFKKVMPSTEKNTSSTTSSAAHKLDKLNLLFYSSSMAFVLMIPIWMWTDLPHLWGGSDRPIAHPSHGHSGSHSTNSLPWAFFINGTVHFAQNAIAFIILSSTSPVTYSIASLVKRVAVICIAIVWFAQPTHPVQALGIGLTSVGLWCYNNAKSDVAAGERRVRRVERARDLALPSTNAELAAEGMQEKLDTVPALPVRQAFAPPPMRSGISARRNSRSTGSVPPSGAAPPPQTMSITTDADILHSYAQHRAAAGHAPLSIRITPPTAHPGSVGAGIKLFEGDGPTPQTAGYPSPPDSPPVQETLHATGVSVR